MAQPVFYLTATEWTFVDDYSILFIDNFHIIAIHKEEITSVDIDSIGYVFQEGV